MKLLRFPHKKIRAKVIKSLLPEGTKIVCFSCGNASRALVEEGLNVLNVSKTGDLNALRWFTKDEIKYWFKDCFDATSGHLDIEYMYKIGLAFKKYLGKLPNIVYLPTGSGETLVELSLVYPKTKFIAVYNLDDATEYSEYAPLNKLVECLAYKVIK